MAIGEYEFASTVEDDGELIASSLTCGSREVEDGRRKLRLNTARYDTAEILSHTTQQCILVVFAL
jgi:hypothetical protein